MKFGRQAMSNPVGNNTFAMAKSPILRGARTLLSLAALLAACDNQALELDPTAEVMEAITVSASSVTTQQYLYPTQLDLQRQLVSDQPLAVLAVKDQSGTGDTWNNYLEFYPDGAGLTATFTFTVPTSVDLATLSGLTLLANYKGSTKTVQSWKFQLYDVTQSKWVLVGDNQPAQSWVWSALAFVPTGSTSRFVSASRAIRLRLTTSSGVDNCALDYLALGFNGGSSAAPAPTPPPPPSPPPTGTLWMPKPGTSWQIQFAGTIDTTVKVTAYDLDLDGTTQTTIANLHSRGSKVICYLSGGTYENWRADAKSFPSSVLGASVGGWPGENWLDVRQLAILGPIMTKRMDLAVQKGCDAIDSDNMDGYSNSPGFPITYAQQIAYNRMIATEAHKRGLSIGLKNDLAQIADLVDLYDFAINESCMVYGECGLLKPFIAGNKAVFGLEYVGTPAKLCAQANTLNFDTLFKHENLDSYRVPCR